MPECVTGMTPLWDVNVAVGRPMRRSAEGLAEPDALLHWMQQAPVDRATIWHYAQHDCAPDAGNALVAQWTSRLPQVTGCWTLMPSATKEVQGDLLDAMAAHRIVALRAFPLHHNYILDRTACGELLQAASDHSVPLLLSLQRGMGWGEVYALLREFPQLLLVLCDIGVWSPLRYLWPLMSRYPRVYAESSQLSLTMGALETTVQRYGAHRVLFGSGYPERYIEAALLDLLHADIREADRHCIAWDNACRLFGASGDMEDPTDG